AILPGRLHENFRDCGRLTGELREMRCRYAEMVAVGEHRESDTTITVWDDEKSAWRSIPLARLSELRIDGRAARGRTLKSVIANRKHPGARMTPRGIDPTRRRRAMPSVRQPPADFRKLSSQFQIGHGILWNWSKLEGPSVDRGNRQPKPQRKRTL